MSGRGVLWRTGSNEAPVNAALDAAQRVHVATHRRPVLRLYGSGPAASLGAFEEARHALRVDYCDSRGIPIVRRPTGGGSWYLDEGQLLWSLMWPSDWVVEGSLERLLARLGSAVVEGLTLLGIRARFAGSNDIEVDGRKLGVVSAGALGDVRVAHGSLLLDVVPEHVLKVLRVPREKLSPEGIASARERLVTVRELTGMTVTSGAAEQVVLHGLRERLGLTFARSRVPETAWDPVDSFVEDTLGEEALEAFVKADAGIVHASVCLDVTGSRVTAARFSGPLHAAPANALELAGLATCGPLERAPARAAEALRAVGAQIVGVGTETVIAALRRALARAGQQRAFDLAASEANTLMLHGAAAQSDGTEVLERAGVILVPYCAKPVWCKWRHRAGCPECGHCEVGEVYRLGRERGLEVITIVNYEHLRETLHDMRERGVESYVGMCCSNFFIKRQRAFRESGLPAVLMDISGSNCYELQQEQLAYEGRFEAQARLNAHVTEKVLRFIPQRPETTKRARPGRRR